MWKCSLVNKHHVFPECWEQDHTQPVPHCCSLILKSKIVLLLHVTNGFLLVQPSLPHTSACAGASCGWGGNARWVLMVPCLRQICHFLNSFTPAPPVQGSVTPDKLHRVTSLKPLLWIVNFDPPLVLDIGRWLIKNIMVMGYVLDELFQELEQGSEGAAGQRKAFLKPVCHQVKYWKIHNLSPWSVCSGAI